MRNTKNFEIVQSEERENSPQHSSRISRISQTPLNHVKGTENWGETNREEDKKAQSEIRQPIEADRGGRGGA